MSSDHFVLAVHGGAGTIARGSGDVRPYHEGLHAALRAGEEILRRGGTAADAVQAAVMSLEDCPLFNAGRGSVYTSDQTHEMDAAIMEGTTLRAGGVAGVHGVRNPVRLARHVMEASGAVLLAGEGAQRYAREHGLVTEPPAYFHTDQRLAQLRILQAGGSRQAALDHDIHVQCGPLDETRKFGTVGAVARDLHGGLAAAVSTGGMTNKRPGRIGDSPLVGCGLYANDATCAVCATGTGEYFIRAVAAHDVHARMQYRGASLREAADAVVHGTLRRLGGEGGLVAVDADGNVCMPFNSRGMYRGIVRAGIESLTWIFPVDDALIPQPP
jgi:L-asparaginase / beta-aspartyl-peptidase